jgi:hypothetical protein
MKGIEYFIFFVAVVAIFTIVHVKEKSRGVWINCAVSEISPDFTPEMRELCRQHRRANASRTKQ